MDVNSAVKRAKEYVNNLFEGESISDVGLEEVVFDEPSAAWEVTVGFARPWKRAQRSSFLPFDPPLLERDYKVVRVKDADGTIESVKIRQFK